MCNFRIFDFRGFRISDIWWRKIAKGADGESGYMCKEEPPLLIFHRGNFENQIIINISAKQEHALMEEIYEFSTHYEYHK